MTVATLPRLLTVSQCAEQIEHAVSERTLWREIARGHLVARRIGKCTRVLDYELARWLEANGTTDVPGVQSVRAAPRSTALGAAPGTSVAPHLSQNGATDHPLTEGA